MAHICLGFLKSCPSLREDIAGYFDGEREGAFWYSPSQLARTNGLTNLFPLAVKMSAYINIWVGALDRMSWISDKLRNRLKDCAFSYGSIAKRTTTCDSKLCFLCRATRILHLEGFLQGRQTSPEAHCATITELPLSNSLPVTKSVPGAILTVKNVILQDDKFLLKVASFVPCSPVNSQNTRKLCKIIRGILSFDFNTLTDRHLSKWTELTSGMRFFTRPK
jgi:hypothetical protein